MSDGDEVILVNPDREYFPGFVFGNSQHDPPVPVVQAGSGKGRELVICGAGPSLEEHAAEYCTEGRDVWGCNRALTYLMDRNIHVTHGVAIDQSSRMWTHVWADPPPVAYLLATTVNPTLVEHLRQHGTDEIEFFHSYVAIEDEGVLYGALYPMTVVAGDGLNVVNRALCVAEYMEYDHVYILGADCAMRGDQMHAGAEKTEDERPLLRGQFRDNRGNITQWATTADMLFSAIDLAKKRRAKPDWLDIVGDTLPSAMRGKGQKFFDRCIRFQSQADLTVKRKDGRTTRRKGKKPKGRRKPRR